MLPSTPLADISVTLKDFGQRILLHETNVREKVRGIACKLLSPNDLAYITSNFHARHPCLHVDHQYSCAQIASETEDSHPPPILLPSYSISR